MYITQVGEILNESEKDTANKFSQVFAVSKHISDSSGPQIQLQVSRAKSPTDGKINTDKNFRVVSREVLGSSGRRAKGLRTLPGSLDFSEAAGSPLL